jgi:glutamate-1-semialdehyde 2,1-aminomutase
MKMTESQRHLQTTNKVSNQFLHKQACNEMPLGVADNYRYWGKDTIFVKDMLGYMIYDHDGHEFVDFRLSYGPIILGYRDQRVDNAVINCIRNKGTMCGFSTELEAPLVSSIKALCPNVEKLRFANSGTEAILAAIRTARGFTKRDKIIVVEGGFHGLYDEMMWKADVENWVPAVDIAPKIIPFGAGVVSSSRENVIPVSLNDTESLDKIFKSEGDSVAAILIEPIMGNCGSITATQDYLKFLKSTCDAYGTLLIIDEVKTGFRVAKGGVQELYDLHADITTYAKALGNGYPVAAFGGRADIMDVISIDQHGVVHGGTYTANLIAISAAQATIDVLADTPALQTVAEVGEKIKSILSSVFDNFGVAHSFAGHSSMFGIHFSESVPTNYRDWKQSNSQLYTKFAKNMILSGVMLEPDSREPWFICEAHKNLDLTWLRAAVEHSMRVTLDES